MYYPRTRAEVRETDRRDEAFYQDKLYILEYVRRRLLPAAAQPKDSM